MKNDRINSSIQEHIKEVERKIEEACARGNRNREDITLIAVSKTKPLENHMRHMKPDVVILEKIRYRKFWKRLRKCRRMPDFI